MNRPISVQLSSTIEIDDIKLAWVGLLKPWNAKKGEEIGAVESWFTQQFNGGTAISFNSARSALFAILTCLGISKGDEVILQAFTCIVVPNAILWTGAKPVYVDVEKDSFQMSVADLRLKINAKTKAIIVQHTFGYPDDIKKIRSIAKDKSIFLVEDCAHSLGNKYEHSFLGTFGDAAIFSFGRDKVVSSVFGGMAYTKNTQLAEKLTDYQQRLSYPSYTWIIQQLLHPIFFSFILPLYSLQVGKILLRLFQELRMLSFPVSQAEYRCHQPSYYPLRYPNALARLAIGQLKKLSAIQQKRQEAAYLYWKKLNNLPIILPNKTEESLLRFSILTDDPDNLVLTAKKKNILLGRWYSHVIDPKRSDLKKAGYILGSCPHSEQSAKRVVNLPTSPVLTNQEIYNVIHLIKKHYENNHKRNI